MQLISGGSAAFRLGTTGYASAFSQEQMRVNSYSFDQILSGKARSMIDAVANHYVHITESEAIRSVKALGRLLENFALPNRVMQLDGISELQHAPDVMIPYIMAEPTVRRMYLDDRCEGYGDKYINLYGDLIGSTDPVYQTVTHGMWVDQGNGELECHMYSNVAIEHDQQMSMPDQLNVLRTWDSLRSVLDLAKEDPTSRWNGLL